MLGYLGFLVLFNFNFMLIQSLVPSLSVRKISQSIVQQKRQDTLDTCRLFINENKEALRRPTTHPPLRRSKRGIDSIFDKPLTGSERVQLLEKIVAKVYGERKKNGTTVGYRKLPGKLENKTKTESGRRFDFAPAFLEGPREEGQYNYSIKDVDPVPVDWHKKWPNGIIPYFIDSKTYDTYLADEVIGRAFEYFEKATCIRLQRLRERPLDSTSLTSVDWIYITNPIGIRQCVHSNEIKPNEGVQVVVFGYDCMSMGEIVHEIMHVMGFSHEHTRPDRDRYISILWDNIKPGYKKYFETRRKDQLTYFPYDYSSVLHYPPRAFSKNGKITILTEPGIKLGQREGLSETDVEKISMIFGDDCVNRNKQYLYHTCPIVVNTKVEEEVKRAYIPGVFDYYGNRMWPFGIVNYKIRDKMEFTIDEISNIKAVIEHIERETCIEFRDLNENLENSDVETDGENQKLSDTDIVSDDNKINTDSLSENAISDGTQSMKSSNDEAEIVTDANKTDNREADNTEDGNTKGGNTEDGNTEGGNTEGGNNEDGNTEGGNTEGGNTEGGNTEDGNTEGGKTEVNNSEAVNTEAVEAGISESDSQRVNDTVVSNERRSMRNKTNNKKGQVKPKRPLSASRRHANNILVLTRTSDSNCPCPPPGRPESNGIVKIGSGCFNSVNDLLHLFVHVLGLEHQHNSHDRDSYIKIVWDQLSPELTSDLKVKLPPAAAAGYSYDYNSIMHYPWLEIKAGKTSLMYPIWNDGWSMGHWQGLSTIDVKKINYIYGDECNRRNRATEPQKESSSDDI